MRKRIINLDFFQKRNTRNLNEETSISALSPKRYNKFKTKYKFPSLEKYEFVTPQRSKKMEFPLLEEKKIPSSFSSKILFINKKEINKENYERVPPSFRLSPELSCLEQLKEHEKLKKRLRICYDIIKKQQLKKGGDTTEKFFKSITKRKNNICIKDINSLSFMSSKYFLNDEFKTHESLNKNDSFNVFKNKLLKLKINSKNNNKKIFDGRYSKNFQSVNSKLRSLSIEKKDKDFLNTEQVINKILTKNKY